MQDSAPARRAMVDSQLRPQGVTDAAVLAAMADVPRENFVPAGARDLAYSDRSIPVDGGVIIPPASLARLLAAAAPVAGERALVVSAAGGYAAAVLRHIGCDTVECMLPAPPPPGPFDLVLIEGAVAEVPATITAALAPGGRLVTAVLADGGGTRLAIGREIAGMVSYTRFADSEIPALPGFAPLPVFTF